MPDTDDDEFDRLLRDRCTLSPEQYDRLVRRAIARAKAYRRETIRCLTQQLFGWIGSLAARLRERTAALRLHKLDDRMLKDIGINRGEIEAVVRPCGQRRRTSCLGTPRSGRVGSVA